MSLRDSLINKFESQIDSWEKQLESLEADAREEKAAAKNQQADADLKLKAKEEADRLRNKIRHASNKVAELKESSEDKIQQIKRDVESWFKQAS
ncbi:hypothetical protein [Ketobacter sp.]|uniref:hypothetical protein n=1 Tax=Ketobacter sp. TaxID=2083498 RepID=UPI000F19DB6D|nr:hypothetical protein [Ketobacter sp.]RLT96956.1 MAG: hypothetical protein D9N14_13105 [Ketobacter sp.]